MVTSFIVLVPVLERRSFFFFVRVGSCIWTVCSNLFLNLGIEGVEKIQYFFFNPKPAI